MKFLLLLALGAFVLVQLSSANKRPTKKPNNVALEPVPQNMTNATVLTLLNEKATQEFIIGKDKRYSPAVPVQLLWFKVSFKDCVS